MTPRQWKVTAVVSIAMAIILAVVVVVVASSGDDGEEAINTERTTTSSSTTQPPVTTTSLPPILPPATSPPATINPGTTLVVPTQPPVTQPPATTTTKKPPTTTTTEPDGGDSDVGITPTEIQLAVIADDATAFEGMTAWMNTANKTGIAGRKVRLDLLSTNGTSEGYATAVQTACEQDFAIVGTFSVFDTTTESAGCGAIPDIPVEAVAPARQVAPNTYAAFPRRPATVSTGAFSWIAGNVAGCCSQYWLVPDGGAGRDRTLADVDAAAALGFDTAGTADVGVGDPPTRYDEVVQDMIDTNATFAASGLGYESTVLLRRAAAAAGTPDVKAFFCNADCYDAGLLTDGGDDVEDQLVAIETAPIGDRALIASLRSYFKAATKAGNDPTYEGLRAFVAGLLFEQAAEQLVDQDGNDGLTRVRLLEVLGGIHDFTGGGIVGTTDVGARQPNGCYALLEVQNDRFVRKNPAAKGQLDCGPQNLTEIGD